MITRLSSVLVLIATMLGCSALVPQLEKPRLSLASVKLLEGSGVMQQKLLVGVRVVNPNARDLPVEGIDLALELDGQRVADGTSARSFIVPAQSEAEFDMQVTANLAGALLKLAARRKGDREAIPYRLTGRVATRIGMLRSIPFSDSGAIPLGGVP